MKRAALYGFLMVCLMGSMLPISYSQVDWSAKTAKAMEALKSKTNQLGLPKLEGEEKVSDKKVPGLYFGTTKMNNNFTVIDEVKKENSGTATLFVKSGDEYVRITTNVQKDDGSRALGTILDPKGKAIVAINNGESFAGDVDILGKTYNTRYEPIKDSKGAVIGIWYVGYLKLE
ncbi:MAG: Cache 3/Cache 2 fusion domain-containing protein [Oligoflexia bacterium]|nr:Cache 3/Cache 2 fusion domain-containing protein [Oligoflexia bacterium]MBF0364422.1 Cache 3/Cache 2 fusion domain-containing protein [Oligoflexia bacterium]